MSRTHRFLLAIVVLVCCTGFDQLTKDIARDRLAGSPPVSLLNDMVRIQYSENPGAILGLGSDLPDEARFVLFVLLNGLISILTIVFALKTPDLRAAPLLGLLLIASGGTGNLIDRWFNNGFAIDFLTLGIGPIRTGIFNFADVFIVAGVILFALFSLRAERKANRA